MSCLTKLVWSVSLNIFIVLGSSRYKLHAVGGMMSCFRKPCNPFSLISIHRDRCSTTSHPKENNPPWFATSEADQYMPLIGQSYHCWYVIGEFEYPCRLHIVLVSPCVFIHVFTSNASLFHTPIRIIYSPWCIHFEISLLIFIKNWVLGSFWILMITRDSSSWIYDPLAISITVDKYVVMIMVLIFFFPCSNIHDQQCRLLNYQPIVIALHDTFSTAMIFSLIPVTATR